MAGRFGFMTFSSVCHTALPAALAALALSACSDDRVDPDAPERGAIDGADREEIAQEKSTDGLQEGGLVTVQVSGVRIGAGDVYAAVQTRAQFADAAASFTNVVPADTESLTIPIKGVTPGTYAVSVFQDTDGDAAIQINSDGPAEPYGFSGGVQGGWPEFDIASFEVPPTGARAEVVLQDPVSVDDGS